MASLFHHLQDKYEQVFDQQLRIAVTGLSRSGKTAFITSFINQLLTLDGDKSQLPFFTPAAKGWIKGVAIVPQKDLTVPTFPYLENINSLKGQTPVWPKATTDISTIRLAIKYQLPRSLWDRVKDINFKDIETLYVDIVDYPGEWLLDLPLLNLSYDAWSSSSYFVASEQRKTLAQDWLQALANFDPKAKADEEQIRQITKEFTNFLHACKAQGLEYIQPGRFVLPGSYQNAPILQFFPLVNYTAEQWQELNKFARNNPESAIAVLQKRYQTYVQTFVKDFYKEHFERFDRQIILIDCLTPLNHSAQAFNETQLALEQIFQNFQYGSRNLWNRLFSPQIDKLVFAASKTDHVTSDQVANLTSLLKQLTQNNNRQASYQNITTDFVPVASIRATQQLEVEKDGKVYKVLQGKSKENNELKYIYPGSVPPYLPEASFWQNHTFAFEEFAPLPISPQGKISSLGMDRVFEILLGDKFK
ncbi:hypothetical protein CKF54_02720 [Psittacicella hinzii]|uniref:YcjX family protein n=1 Tax=Psittacicella hinzii TaxID=2028575 RepID=A0A3A1Y8J7_9GAMM|nr:YcjX family protein [Psittacicella hinzii]RIY33539.1 hypothetical protein CKF54_02720 [Psittacicella hinzii]